MTTVINILLFTLLLVLFGTIANLVFTIGELKEHTENKTKHRKSNPSISIIKLTMYALIKLVIFALIINLLMFEFYNNATILIITQFLLMLVCFQIILESFSLNHMMRLTVKSLNKFSTGELNLREYFAEIFPKAYKHATSGKEMIFWAISLSMNVVTIAISVYLYTLGLRTSFFQNLIIYFVILLYIKYSVLKLIKEVGESNQ